MIVYPERPLRRRALRSPATRRAVDTHRASIAARRLAKRGGGRGRPRCPAAGGARAHTRDCMTRTATVTEIPLRVCRAHPITAAAQVVEDTIARSEQEALQVLAVVAVGVARLCEDIMHAVLLLRRAPHVAAAQLSRTVWACCLRGTHRKRLRAWSRRSESKRPRTRRSGELFVCWFAFVGADRQARAARRIIRGPDGCLNGALCPP
jgi:hypothetical protein